MELLFIKCDEVVVEDLDQCDVHDSFLAMEEDCVKVIDDDGEELFVLDPDLMEFDEESTTIEVPENFYAHATGWRTSQLNIILNDPNHKLKQSDFTWSWYIIGEYEYQVPALKEEVGELEFDCSWDGRYDEVLEIDGRPGPDEDDW